MAHENPDMKIQKRMTKQLGGSAAIPIRRRDFLRHAICAASTAGFVTPWIRGATAYGAGKTEGQWTIVVTIDTLRADHCGYRGYPRPTTPFLDKLAAKGLNFTRCYSSTGTTLPAHTTLFTGLELPQHGIQSNRSSAPVAAVKTLAEMFAARDYRTAGFVSIYCLPKLSRGFQKFDGSSDEKVRYRWGEHTLSEASDYLRTRSPWENVFVWVHVFDPHEWMNNEEPQSHLADMKPLPEESEKFFLYWTDRQHKGIKTDDLCISGMRYGDRAYFIEKHLNYDSRIRYTTDCLQSFFDLVENIGPKKNTLWILTADHGEALGNHRYDQHARYLYNEILHVPLIIYASDKRFPARSCDATVGHIDLVPTLADLFNWQDIGQSAPLQGRPLTPFLRGEQKNWNSRTIFAQREVKHPDSKISMGWADNCVYCLQDRKCKCIVHEITENEYYNLEMDPFELNNQSMDPSENRDVLQKKALGKMAYLRTHAVAGIDQGVYVPSKEENEALRALGYL